MSCLAKAKVRIILQALLIYVWLTNLTKTDSFLTVYLLCGLLGVLGLWDNEKTAFYQKNSANVLMNVLSFLFAAATVLANYPLFEPVTALLSMMNIAGSLLGGFCVARNVLLFAIRHFPLKVEKRSDCTGYAKATLVFWMCFLCIGAAFLLYLFTTGYPVYLAADSLTSLKQIQTGIYSNHHPYWYTRFIAICLDFGFLFTTDINVACAVYSGIQGLILAACFAYGLVTLYQAGLPWWGIVCVLGGYALLPYNLTYSITMWKDTLFGGFSLLLVAAVYRILWKLGKCHWLNYLVFILGSVGFCLVRHNGFPLLLIWAVFLFLFCRKKHRKLLIILSIVLVFCWFLTGPMLNILNVEKSELVEILAVPFQQIARVIANDCPIGDADMEILNKIFQIDLVKERYSPEIVDPIKFECMRSDGQAYLQEHMGEFVLVWLRLGIQNFGEYVKAWVELTKGFWNGGYYFWIYIRNTYQATSGVGGFTMDNVGKDIYDALFRYMEKPVIFQPLYSIGLQVWTIIGCCFVCFVNKRREFLVAIPMVTLSVLLWFLTPVYAEFRYAYPMFVTCPVILLTTLFSPEDRYEAVERTGGQ